MPEKMNVGLTFCFAGSVSASEARREGRTGSTLSYVVFAQEKPTEKYLEMRQLSSGSYNRLAHNHTSLEPLVFFLSGIPGLEHAHRWISIPFCSVFVISLLGNCSLLYVIKTDQSLHNPMFFLLSMLSSIDLVLSLTTTPKTLAVFWFKAGEIGLAGCLVQMFFLHSFSIMESAVLLAMSFDRYVAICHPLRYHSILTHSLVAKAGLVALMRAVALMLPLPFLLGRLSYCHSFTIAHCYCEHMALVRLACSDTRFNNLYGIFVALLIVGLDLGFILLSYAKILRAVLSLATKEEQHKAFGTCLSHMCAILVFYVPVVLSSVIHRFGHHVPAYIHILLANFYLLFPPMMNPIIYGVQTKRIRERALHLFHHQQLLRKATL
ncbi:olfactory receptor 52K1-like [Protobothrops mucrosquamatus]|uniref:olfactory receptor 52K1-like n=1 Tax=Protobothrops mucrosquamatus TaxID=103944 RepID=UPI0007759E78|nr:olfactory receptor 52K1-like [Protobothrops mucrosquamatus]